MTETFKQKIESWLTARHVVTCLILVLPWCYFWPATRGRIALLMGDSWIYSLLMRMLLGEFINSGTLPLWNPYTFGGLPLLATIQPGVLYPPNWLFAVLSPVTAMNVVVITTYHLALAGTYRFARSLSLDRLPALGASFIFAFGGFLIGHLEDTNYIAATAWLPWILLALQRLAARLTWRWISLGAVFIALQCFAGLPQATWQIILVSVPYAVFLAWELPGGRDVGSRRKFMVAAFGMGLIGVFLACVQLLPALELQRLGERARIDYDSFSMFSLSGARLLTLVFPYFFGGAMGSLYQVPGWDEWWATKFGYGYVAMLGLLFASFAVCLRGRSNAVRFWLGLAAVALLMTLGENLPLGLNQLLYRIPIHNLFRGPYRHFFEWNFAVSMLAGYGWQALRHTPWPQLRRALLISLSWLGALTCITALLYRFFQAALKPGVTLPPNANAWRNPEFWLPCGCYVASAGALWLAARRPTQWTQVLLAVLLLCDLALFGQYTQWRVTGAEVTDYLATPPALKFIQQREPTVHSYRLVNDVYGPFGENYEALNHANLAVVRHLHNVQGYDPMRPARPAWLAGGMDIFGNLPHDTFELPHRGLDLLNAKYLLHQATDERKLSPERWRKLESFGPLELYENLRALPRAWLVSRLVVQPRAAVRQTIQSGLLSDGTPFDPQVTALVEQEDLPRFTQGLPALDVVSPQAAAVKIVRYEPQHITLELTRSQSGFLVLSENYYPGWAVWVDGKHVPVQRVNYALRGVAIPAGAQQVEFRYLAPTFWQGAALSGFGVILLIGGAILTRRRFVALTERKGEVSDSKEREFR